MRKIREVLRLKFEVGLSARQIAVSVQVGRVTVGDYLNRFAASGLIWPCSLSDAELEQQLFPPAPVVSSEQRPLMGACRTAPPRRNPGAALAGIPSESTAGLPVQLVLRTLPSLAGQAGRGDAPGASRR